MKINGKTFHGRTPSRTKRGPGRYAHNRPSKPAPRPARGIGSYSEHDTLVRMYGSRIAWALPPESTIDEKMTLAQALRTMQKIQESNA